MDYVWTVAIFVCLLSGIVWFSISFCWLQIAHAATMVLQCSPEKADLTKLHDQKLDLYLTAAPEDVEFITFKRKLEPPPGPQTQLQRIQWASQMWDSFTPTMRSRLCENLTSIVWSEYYAGMGSFSQIICQIKHEVDRHRAVPLDVPKTFAVVEVDPVRTAFLNAFDDAWRSTHACGDLLDRLGPCQKREVEKMKPTKSATILAKKVANNVISSHLRDRYRHHGWSHAFAPCSRHCRNCPVSPLIAANESKADMAIDLEESTSSRSSLRVGTVGGPVCRDASSMNQHASGDGGQHFVSTSVFLTEFNMTSPSVAYVECTKRWAPSLMQQELPNHKCAYFHLDGSQVGDCYKRARMGCLAYDPETYTLSVPLTDFLLYAERVPMFDPNLFWNTDTVDAHYEMLEWKKVRGCTVADEDLTWEDLMLDSQHYRLQLYEADFRKLIDAGTVGTDSSFAADLDQSPEFNRGRMAILDGNSAVPTLIQRGWHWHNHKRSPLTCLDQLKMHCWPISNNEIAEVGCATDIRSLLAHGEMTHKQLISMCGDSWHLRYQGCFMMFVLASLVDVTTTSVPRSPVSFPDDEAVTPDKPSKRARLVTLQQSTSPGADSSDGSPRSLLTISVHSSPAPLSPP